MGQSQCLILYTEHRTLNTKSSRLGPPPPAACMQGGGRSILPPMLRSLRVKNLALVEEVAVEFQPGLNVITGETGAGKSVLVGALGLLLGDRADRALVRAGAEQCQVEATFQLADSGPIDQRLDESGLAPR